MSKNNTIRVSLLVLAVFVLANIVYAAVPQSTIRTTGGGITTYVGHYLNGTLGWYQGTTERLNAGGEATFTNLTLTGPFLNGYNIRDHLGYPQQPASYIIFTDGTNYYAKNGTTGNIESNNTNGETALQYAVNNCPSYGTISIQGTILLNATNSVYVAGWTSSIVIESKILTISGGGTIKLEDNTVGGTGVIIFYINGTSNVTFDLLNFDCNLANIDTPGTWVNSIFVDDTATFKVSNSYFTNYKWAIYGDPNPGSINYMIYNNKFYSSTGQNAIGIHNYGDNSQIIGNNIYQCGIGIFLDTCKNVQVKDNFVWRFSVDAVEMYDNADRNTIANNQFVNRYGAGPVTAVKITSNTCDNNLFTDNMIDGSTYLIATGFSIQGTNNTLYNNKFVSVTTAISDAGTGTLTRNNDGYLELGDLQTNAGNIEMYNGTAWVVVGP